MEDLPDQAETEIVSDTAVPEDNSAPQAETLSENEVEPAADGVEEVIENVDQEDDIDSSAHEDADDGDLNDESGPREPALKLEGVDGDEPSPLEPAELELLSQHEPEKSFEIPEDGGVTPEYDSGNEEHELLVEDEKVSPNLVYNRESLIQQYRESLEERVKIQQQNQTYQHKLFEYFKKKKTDERGQEIEKNANDQEQRYLKYMSNLADLQREEDQQGASIKNQLEEMQRTCTDMEKKVEDASNEFVEFKYDVAAESINSRSGKPIPAKDLEQYQSAEAKKEQEVITVRLENIKLKNRLKKREQQLKAKEELAEGLHLIDFEQLKIENQTYHEKIEERNEELLKLRKKITTTVQVLTHLKEKLQFVQGENAEQRSKLRDIEVTVAQKRDILTRLKQVRDALRIDNTKLKHKAGLLGNKPLLKDYEIRKDEGEDLRDRLETLKKQHVDLNLSLSGIKKKIEKSKPIHAL